MRKDRNFDIKIKHPIKDHKQEKIETLILIRSQKGFLKH